MTELAIIIPTLNERTNVVPLIERLDASLGAIRWEAVFVDDDSSDGTAAFVRELALRDPRIRIVHRIGRRGLSSAVIEGILASSAPYLAVIDADLQHDERLLPEMFDKLTQGSLDLVVASRHTAEGSMGEFSQDRIALSNLGKKLSRFVSHTNLTDPMSGFFVVRRTFFEEVSGNLSGLGFKILLDMVASSSRPVRFEEVPYTFRNRLSGESKLDSAVNVEYLMLLADKVVGHFVPIRFALFVMVGFVGLIVYCLALAALHFFSGLSFLGAHAFATFLAIACNFSLNNAITYYDRRLKGSQLVWGLLSFTLACGIGAVANFGFARVLLTGGLPWYAAGFIGMAVSSVWNFGVTAIVTWRRAKVRAVRFSGVDVVGAVANAGNDLVS